MNLPRPHIDERYVFSRLGGIAWAGLATTTYVTIGAVVDRAAGLSAVAFLIVALFVGLTALSYTELTGLRDGEGRRLAEVPGAAAFARLGFNELWSFIAAWAVVLDLLLLTAIGAEAFAGYLASIVEQMRGSDAILALLSVGAIVAVGFRNARTPNLAKGLSIRLLLLLDAVVLAILAVVLLIGALRDGLPLVELTDGVSFGDVAYAATIGVVAVTGFETAATLAGETPVEVRRRSRFLLGLAAGSVLVLVLGGALGAAHRAELEDPEHLLAPVAWLAGGVEPGWLSELLRVTVAVLASVTLAVATNGAMLAVTRLATSLATTRQIPAKLGRLSSRSGTPNTVIALVVVLTALLVLLLDLRTLIGLYAFGALLALALVHASLIRLRFRLPGATRRFRVPLSIPMGGGSLPIPTLVAGLASIAGWGVVVAAHGNAGIVGGLWMLAGLTLYVTTRRRANLPLRGAVTVPKTVLSRDTDHGEFGSILVPVFGRKLDDDIVQSAGRLARDRALDLEESGGAQIEAIWVFEIPMSLPLGSAVDEDRLKAARAALARAKAVGEEYEGVGVATATVRARRAGQGIVEEARRRGVDVIVMAAEEPSRVRGGSTYGGTGDFSGRALGPTTSYVLANAPCRVLLTAPPLGDRAVSEDDGAAPDGQPE